MTERTYFETINGDIVDNYDIAKAVNISLGIKIDYTNLKEVDNVIQYCLGITGKLNNPTVEMFLNKGEKIQAIRLFYLTHPGSTLSEAKQIVEDMEKVMVVRKQ